MRSSTFLLRVGLVAAIGLVVSTIVGPRLVHADALPGDRNDIYYHCTPAEQCPDGSKMCTALNKGAGRREVEPACAEEARGKTLEQRCLGKDGYLFCPKGASGSFTPTSKPSENASKPPPSTRGGC